MRTDYIPKEILLRILEALTPENALVMELCMCTGMRVTDALRMTYEDARRLVSPPAQDRLYYTYTEQKTGKERTVFVSRDWLSRAVYVHDVRSPWLFAGRDPEKHRTRQAVWKDLHRAAKLYRVNGRRLQARVGPHTARKVYAVDLYHQAEENGVTDPLELVRADLNHKDTAVTFIYALADEITARKRRYSPKKAS